MEAVTLSPLGGLIGLMVVTISFLALAHLLHVPYVFNLPINLTPILFAGAMGVLFGYLPARRAAALDPIEALRHE